MNRLREGDEFYATEKSRTLFRYGGRRNAIFLSESSFGVDKRPFHEWQRADGKGSLKKGYEYTGVVWVERS